MAASPAARQAGLRVRPRWEGDKARGDAADIPFERCLVIRPGRIRCSFRERIKRLLRGVLKQRAGAGAELVDGPEVEAGHAVIDDLYRRTRREDDGDAAGGHGL